MFSVIIPVHNKLAHLERSINCVLNQTFKDFELLLIDDASTDGSSEKLKEFKDPRIRHFYRDTPGAGGYAARNLGIRNAQYEWICFLDADDEWATDYLTCIKMAIENNPSAQFISIKWERAYEQTFFPKQLNFETKSFDLWDYIKDYTLACTISVTIKKDLLTTVGLFPENNSQCRVGGDIDTWLRCLSISKKNIHINKLLAYYYQGTQNQVTDIKKNPNNKFCAYETLHKLYKKTKDKEKKALLRFYINSKILHIIREPNGFTFSLLFKMYPTKYAIKKIIKIFLYKRGLLKSI